MEAMKEMEKVQPGSEGGELRGQALRGSGRFCWQIRERTLQVETTALQRLRDLNHRAISGEECWRGTGDHSSSPFHTWPHRGQGPWGCLAEL